jgi:hypothetical protein
MHVWWGLSQLRIIFWHHLVFVHVVNLCSLAAHDIEAEMRRKGKERSMLTNVREKEPNEILKGKPDWKYTLKN